MQPVDPAYQPINTSGYVSYVDESNCTVDLNQVIFCGMNYAANVTIVAVAVLLNSVVGYQVVQSVQPLAQPTLLGPQTDCLTVGGKLMFCDFSNISDCDWGQ